MGGVQGVKDADLQGAPASKGRGCPTGRVEVRWGVRPRGEGGMHELRAGGVGALRPGGGDGLGWEPGDGGGGAGADTRGAGVGGSCFGPHFHIVLVEDALDQVEQKPDRGDLDRERQ